MILLKIIGVLGLIAFVLMLCTIAGFGLAHTVVGILIGINDGDEGLNQYDDVVWKEKLGFKKLFRSKRNKEPEPKSQSR